MGLFDIFKKSEEEIIEETLTKYNIFEGIECTVILPEKQLRTSTKSGVTKGVATFAFGVVGLAATSGFEQNVINKMPFLSNKIDGKVRRFIYEYIENKFDDLVFEIKDLETDGLSKKEIISVLADDVYEENPKLKYYVNDLAEFIYRTVKYVISSRQDESLTEADEEQINNSSIKNEASDEVYLIDYFINSLGAKMNYRDYHEDTVGFTYGRKNYDNYNVALYLLDKLGLTRTGGAWYSKDEDYYVYQSKSGNTYWIQFQRALNNKYSKQKLDALVKEYHGINESLTEASYDDGSSYEWMIFVDVSGSWIKDHMTMGLEALQKKIGDLKRLNAKILYFASYVAETPENAGRGSYGEPVLTTIKQEQPTNVAIITDSDIMDCKDDVTIPGRVVFMFRDSEVSKNFIDHLHGKQGTAKYSFYTSDRYNRKAGDIEGFDESLNNISNLSSHLGINEDTNADVEQVRAILAENGDYYDVYEKDGKVAVEVEWGDWKHDHLYLDRLLSSYGFEKVDEEETEEDGSDTYSSIHYFENSDNYQIDEAVELYEPLDGEKTFEEFLMDEYGMTLDEIEVEPEVEDYYKQQYNNFLDHLYDLSPEVRPEYNEPIKNDLEYDDDDFPEEYDS